MDPWRKKAGKTQEKKTWSQENEYWKQIAKEFRHWEGSMGSFHYHLCEAIVRADLANTQKLRGAYPELVHWIQEEDL